MPKPKATRRAKSLARTQTPPSLPGSRPAWLIYLALFLATFAVYGQVYHFDFVNFDDTALTIDNAHVQQGLTARGLAWALTAHDDANWAPLTNVSHMLDCQLFGVASGWHHLHNVLLHALASILLFIFLERATHARWRSALVALLFALHPLHVESVAWVAERKDVLCACFWFLTLWAYVRYAERRRLGRYLAVALGLCLALMSKPMAVTLPLVLLLLDYWPLAHLRRQGRKALWEKLPLLALSGADAVITYLVQTHAGTVKVLPLETRLANALYSCAVYIGETFWPSRLAVYYPYPRHFAFLPLLAAGLLLTAITVGVIVLRRRFPYLLTGWGWFAVTLIPVIGLVQAGSQARADRYMYLPMVGVLIMVVWGADELIRRWQAKAVAVPLAVSICVTCAVLTYIQAGYWRNSETLFRHALDVTDDSSVANHHLGIYLMALPERLSEAISYLEAAVNINPDSASARTDLGTALENDGRLPEAIEQYQKAIVLDPDAPIPHSNLGTALAKSGHLSEAIEQFQLAIHLAPDQPTAHNNLGSALEEAGRQPEAISEFETALRLNPNYENARQNLNAARAGGPATDHLSRATALANANDIAGAIAELEAALRADPNNAVAENNLGVALTRFPERRNESIAHFEAAVRLKPDFGNAQLNLGLALAGIPGRQSDAIRHLEAADRLRPDPQLERTILQLQVQRQ